MARRHVFVEGQVDLFPPQSDWQAPTSLPAIPSGVRVAIDTEDNDRGLAAGTGPGWVSRNGWLCGVSYAYRDTATSVTAGYLPTRHPDTSGCFDEDHVRAWLQDLTTRCDVVFQNGPFDMGWTGVRVERPLDTHTMAVLLDENRVAYDLDSICAWLGIAGKDERLLREAAAALGIDPKKVKQNIYKMPARFAAPYAEQDAVATLLAAERMLPQLEANGLMEAFWLESELSPHVMEMRRRGIRIDIDRAEQNQSRLRQLVAAELDQLKALLSHRRTPTINDVRSPRWLEMVFTDQRVAFPRTANGQASFEKDWLEKCPAPFAKHIARARAYNDGAEKFIGTYIMDFLERGRIHAEIHQLRSEDGGTRSYRFSYSNPPLQQMNRAEPDKTDPSHKDYVDGFVDIGTMIRECFLPERDCVWNAPDYSQQEYRLIVHYAARLGLRKADVAVEKYNRDPKTDFHNFVVEMTGLIRKKAKDANFAKAFGAGIPKFALMTNMPLEEAAEVMRTYDEELPFVSGLARKTADVASAKGYIRLIDGRRCRFDQWEASWIPKEQWEEGRRSGKLMTPCSIEEARLRQEDPDHPWRGKRLRRSGTHKAGNRLIQGSAAVQTKKALLACAREGYLPMIQMHDELGFSHDSEAACERTSEIMRDIVPLLVPVRVDNESGSNWGNAKYDFDKAMRMVRERG